MPQPQNGNVTAERDRDQATMLLQAIVDNTTDAVFVKDCAGKYLLFNEAAAKCVGKSVAEVLGKTDRELFDAQSADWLIAYDRRVMRSSQALTTEERLTIAGVERIYSSTKSPFRDQSGQVIGLIGISREITEHKRDEGFLTRQSAVLEQMALGAPLGDVLDAIVRMIEEQSPGLIGSILILDRDGRHLHVGSAPGLPASYNTKIEGMSIGPCAGSCGTAAYRGESVFVADVTTDPLWVDFCALASAHGLRACWSRPILSRKAKPGQVQVLGTFAVYSRQPGLPNARLVELIARAEYLACIAIEADRAVSELRASEARFRAFVDHAADAFFLHANGGVIVDANQQACDSLGYTRDELIGQMPMLFDVGVAPAFMKQVTKKLDANEAISFETRHRRKDGTMFPVEVRIRPFVSDGQRLSISLVRDITAQKEIEAAILERERQLRSLGDNLPGGAVYQLVESPDGGRRFAYFSAGCEALFGLTAYAVCTDAHMLYSRIHPDDAERLARAEAVSKQTMSVFDCEFRHLAPDGTEQWIHCRSNPRQLDDGSIMWDGVAIEATTRRRTVESLQQQTQLLSEAQVLANLGYFDWDLTTGKLTWSDELMRIYGVEPGSFQPTVDDFISRIYPDDRTKVHQTIEQALAAGSTFNMEERIVRPNGQIRTLDSHGRVIVNEAGRPVRVVGACQDVTERKQTEAALSQSVSRLKATLESTADGILVVDLEGRMIDFNEQFLTTWKMRPEYIARAKETDIVAETRNDQAIKHIFEQLCDPQAFIARVQELYADPTATSFDFLPFKDGRIIERFSQPQLIDGVPVGRVWSFRDVTIRHRAEQALLKSEKEFRTLAEHLPAVITRIDRDLRLTYVNNAVTQLLAQPPSEIIGRKLTEIDGLPREFVMARESEIQQAFNTGEPTRVVHVLPTPRGDMHFDVHYVPERNETGEVVGLLSISVDITARKHLEDQLRQSQKMEAIGRLAGGIAHDFNNLLTVIIGTSEMLSTSLAPQGEAVLNEVNEIREAAQRAAGLTRQLLAFSRQQMLKPVVLDPNEIVRRAESLLRRVIGEDITLVTQLSANLGTISADPGQLEQVLLNLAINSRDAMPQGGNLTITTRQIQESGSESFVEITVTDTGTGIPAEVLPRIFDPFFTTKEVGKGTGLGLAVVHGIVEQSGGKIQVRSELGVGTTFSILMPTTKQTPAGAHTPPQDDGRRGKETILVVDDEAAICTIIAHVLGMQGYQVLTAHGAAQAIELVAQHPSNIDLLITDMVMPQMNGELMAQAIRQKLPQLRVVYMSGYYEHESKEKRQPFERMLPKPFTPHDLKAIVRKSLDDI